MLARALVQPTPCRRPQTCWARQHAARRVVCPVVRGQPTDGFLIDTDTLKSLSPEARRVFQEAQENIIEINKGRIRALEELKVAKKRIAELERQLQEAVTDVNQAAEQVNELKQVAATLATPAAAPVQAPPAPALPPAAAPMPAFAAAAPAPAPAAPAAAPAPAPAAQPAPEPEPLVTVLYETAWGTAFLHYNADGKGWTAPPGARMEEGSGEFAGKKVLHIPCMRMEFVANNGKDDWDHPDQFESGGTKNYVVTTPGVYRLKSGKINKVSP